jgi:WXG100 family type VII secretion target
VSTTFDVEAIGRHSAVTRQRAEEMQQAIAALRAAANELSTVWTGPAAARFQATRDEWERAVTPMQESLAAMSSALSGAASAFSAAEDSIAKSFGG